MAETDDTWPAVALATFTSDALPAMDRHGAMSGIYAIAHAKRKLLYVGSSDHIARRWIAHRSQLRRGVHHSKWLQRLWNKDGEAAFTFLLLERVNAALLILSEQTWIDRLRPQLNTDVPAGNPMKGRKHSAESLAKMSAALTGKKRGPRQFSEAHRAALSRAASGRPYTPRKPMTEAQKRTLSDGARKRFSDPGQHPGAVPVTINGVEYTSRKAAKDDLGICYGTLQKAAQSGTWDGPHTHGSRNPKARAVLIDGRRFETQAEAAHLFKVSRAAITYWLVNGRAVYA